MEGDDDYESLPETSTMGTHMLAGAAAGVMEHCVMYPVDAVKVYYIMYLHAYCRYYLSYTVQD